MRYVTTVELQGASSSGEPVRDGGRATIARPAGRDAVAGNLPLPPPLPWRRLPGGAVSAWFPAVLAVVQLGLQLRHCLAGVDYVVAALFLDDTYYFLQPAWNLHNLGFVTFDGINATNGVQLLWFGVAYALAWLAPNKGVLLVATAVTCALLNAAAYPVIARCGAILERRGLAATLSLLWFAVVLSDPLYLRGMDNTLHAFICWVMVWQLAAFFQRLQLSADTSLVPLTTVLILNVWTRLDSALVSAAVFVCCAAAKAIRMREAGLPTPDRLRSVLLPAALAAVGGAVQLGMFWWMGGSVLPVSALVKSRPGEHAVRWSKGFDELVARSFIHLDLPSFHLPDAVVQAVALGGALVLLLGWRVVATSDRPWIGRVTGAASIPLSAALLVLLLEGALTPTGYLLLFALAAIVEVWRFGRDENGAATVRRVWYTVAASFLVYHSAIVPLGMKPGYYSPWYQAPAHVFWILGIGVLLDSVIRLQPRPTGGRAVRLTVVAVLTVAAVVAGSTALVEYERSPLFVATHRAARHIADTAPENAVFASWNAGLLGYFAERTLINLDGLVNTPSYARDLRSDDFRILDYLARNEVEYVVDWSIPDDARPALEPLFTFVTRPDWKPVVIYRFRTSDPASWRGGQARRFGSAIRTR